MEKFDGTGLTGGGRGGQPVLFTEPVDLQVCSSGAAAHVWAGAQVGLKLAPGRS